VGTKRKAKKGLAKQKSLTAIVFLQSGKENLQRSVAKHRLLGYSIPQINI
jgi:hypothetical protein